ncbi:MAG: tRNA pseudouridine(38-40) synthase TruA [Deltaproteobacteria bacterium HGW-Deltaproteobacteria-11]|nr:MAG: tRNA pseudouridine(38-40) synthase TruA [Deltaproteobacteria bacterium HGW-Deltaproteobacteria-11]
MRNLRMVLEYDGTAYHGWQRQTNGLSIQQVLEEKIAVMTGEAVKVIGSGRTDAGVHALGQVAHFKTASTIPDIRFLNGINSLLPRDIAVKALREVDPSFHARYDAKSKVYLYQVVNGSVRPVLLRQYAWFVPGPLDSESIREAAVYFMGTHDFSSFCSTHSDAPDHIRTITDIRIEAGSHGLIKIEMEADGFLRHMVRGIVGTLIEVGRGKRFVSDMQAIIHEKDRCHGGMTAPPQGLFLKEVRY